MSATVTRPNFAENILYYRTHPGDFVRDHLGATPDPWQTDVLRDYPFETAISIVSGNGAGKTALASWLVLHFLATASMGKGVLTAPSHHQLHDNLWAEVAKWHDQSTLGEIIVKMASKYYVRGHADNWFIVPRSTNKKENFQGYHAPNVLILVDEASGVAGEIYEAIEGSRATDHAVVVLISNPTRLSGHFYDTHHKLKKYWRTYRVDSEDRDRVKRVNQSFLDEMAAKYGRNSPIYQVKVRGMFPVVDEMSAVPRLLFEAVFERGAGDVPASAGRQMGVDPARYGNDATGIIIRVGAVLLYAEKLFGRSTDEVALHVAKLAKDFDFGPADPILVDTIGTGAGVFDYLRRHARQLRAVSLNSSESAKDSTQYHNTRTEMFFELAAKLPALATGEKVRSFMDELLEDLCYAQYGFDERGRYIVEKKDRIKEKLGGRSPDLGDATLLATYTPPTPAAPLIFIPGA